MGKKALSGLGWEKMFQFRENCNMEGLGGGGGGGDYSRKFFYNRYSSELISETIFGPK